MLASIHHGGGPVAALVLVVINAEGVKKKKKKENLLISKPAICLNLLKALKGLECLEVPESV